jgi:ABC-2 type transport system ATP-binding protein
MSSLISVKNLSRIGKTKSLGFFKKAEKKTLIDNISFDIFENEWVVILGKNGSGKSTLLKCLSGVLYPQMGYIKFFGKDPWKNRYEVIKNIGVLFGQKSMLFPDLRVKDSLTLFKKVYDLTDSDYKQMLDFADEYLSIESLLEKSVRRMSFGERMKAEFLSIIIHKPKVLILDEPFVGLDPNTQQKILTFLVEYKRRYGCTIILTTHQFLEIISQADRTIVLHGGKLTFNGKLEKIFEKYNYRKVLSIKFSNSVSSLSLPNGVKTINTSHNTWELEVNTKLLSVQKLMSILFQQYEIEDFETRVLPIERVVKDLYEESNILPTSLEARIYS